MSSILKYNFHNVLIVLIKFLLKNMCQSIDIPYSELKNGTKTILIWRQLQDIDPKYYFGLGQQAFVTNNCTETKCYITTNRNYMAVDKYDAVVFNGCFFPTRDEDLPARRSPQQLYIYYCMEPPTRCPMTNRFNDFFNLTVSHRLDSDIPRPYFHVKDHSENVVAPSLSPEWRQPVLSPAMRQQYYEIYKSKTKSAAWFVSRCFSWTKREVYIESMKLNNILVDIYGRCGTLNSSKESKESNELLKKNYFFYLSFENSACKDYMTEKVMTALQNNAVPVVYGGADINKFLPPHSYIDATQYTPDDLASHLNFLMSFPRVYTSYFWWKEFYTVEFPKQPFCRICEILHNETIRHYTYSDLKTWWNGNKEFQVCKPGYKKP